MVVHAHFAQLNYNLHVFDIVQPYQSDLVHLCEHLSPSYFNICFVWSNYDLNVLNITHTYRYGNTCLCVVLGQTRGSLDEIPSVTMRSCKSKTLNEF